MIAPLTAAYVLASCAPAPRAPSVHWPLVGVVWDGEPSDVLESRARDLGLRIESGDGSVGITGVHAHPDDAVRVRQLMSEASARREQMWPIDEWRPEALIRNSSEDFREEACEKLQKGEPFWALRFAKVSVIICPDNERAQATLAYVHLRCGDRASARAAFEKARAVNGSGVNGRLPYWEELFAEFPE